MLQRPYVGKHVFTCLTILRLLLHDATARPVTLGRSSAAIAASTNGSSISPLVFVLPLAGAAVCLLLLAFCCSCQRRRYLHVAKASKTPNRQSRDDTYYGLGIHPSSRANGGYTHLSEPVNQELPPYTPRPVVPARKSDTSPSRWAVFDNGEGAEKGKLLSPPLPIVSRTGSPSLQIWSIPISPYLR